MPEPDHALDRASTPLLTLITQESMDEDYRVAAERRAAEPETPGEDRERARPHRIAAVVVGVFGLLVTVAAVPTSQSASVTDAGRATLISQIDARRDQVAEQQREIVKLRELDVALRGKLDSVTSQAQSAQGRLTRYQTVAGFLPVTGPGVRVVVDDAPDGSALVRDRDLRPLVDGLWAAGAEAIAINGQRLTARTAIRNSGDAIHVNVRALSPPYVVQAIGDPKTLQADLMQTSSGLAFRFAADSLGFPWSMDNEDRMSLPAAPARLLRLRSATAGTAEENRNQHRKESPQ
jgi:uncharacterized protein YlxW (UPF0749 family)